MQWYFEGSCRLGLHRVCLGGRGVLWLRYETLAPKAHVLKLGLRVLHCKGLAFINGSNYGFKT